MAQWRAAATSGLIAISSLMGSIVFAQTGVVDAIQGVRTVPRVGVALSGGGVKGFAHVGALRVIEEVGLPVDVITGTSMGSFVGGLYAIGYSVDQIDSLLHAEDWGGMFEDEPPRREQPLDYRLVDEGLLLSLPVRRGQLDLPRGLVAGHRISQLLSRLFFPAWPIRDFSKLPIPFGAVAVDLSDGEAVLLSSGHLPDVIRASISIPSIFDPVVIDGRTLIDGGVTRNLPAQDARDLGADAVICVDVSEPVLPVDSLHTLVDIMVQAVGFRIRESSLEQHKSCDVLIRPKLKGVRPFDFERTDEIIRLGEEAAEAGRTDLESLRDTLFGPGVRMVQLRPTLLGGSDSVDVEDLVVEGVSVPNERVIRRAMRLSQPTRLSERDLEAGVSRAFGTQRFTRVSYRLEVPPDRRGAGWKEANVVVSATEKSGDRLALGLRYDSDYRAAVLMRILLSGAFGHNTRIVGTLRLGETVRLGATLTTPTGIVRGGRQYTSVEVRRTPIDLFVDGRRTSSLVAHAVDAGISLGGLLAPSVAAAGGVRGELYDIDTRISGTPGVPFGFLEESSSLVFAEGSLQLDTFDRFSFPGRGVKASVRSALSVGPLSSATFGQHQAAVETRVSVHGRVTLIGRVAAARTVGSSAPVHYRYFAGGVFPVESAAGRHMPLFGHELQEVAGPNLRAVWTGVQVEIRHDVFLGLMWNAAAASDRWETAIDPRDFVGGIGLSGGMRTAIGPVQFVVTSRDLDGPFDIHLGVGYPF